MNKYSFLVLETIFWHSEVIHSQSCSWTSWMNRDHPSGSGDFERVNDYANSGVYVCDGDTPMNCECRSVSDGVYFDDYSFGNVDTVYCTPAVGFACVNGESMCPDFEVRFCCSGNATTRHPLSTATGEVSIGTSSTITTTTNPPILERMN